PSRDTVTKVSISLLAALSSPGSAWPGRVGSCTLTVSLISPGSAGASTTISTTLSLRLTSFSSLPAISLLSNQTETRTSLPAKPPSASIVARTVSLPLTDTIDGSGVSEVTTRSLCEDVVALLPYMKV